MTNSLNADPAELAKFSELAHRWWDLESEFRPLHEINPLRLDWIDGISPIGDKRVLDVGCGAGILADSMARKGADVLGIDLATSKTTVYRKVAGEYNEVEGIFPDGEYTLVESSREQLEQNSNYIDIWKLKLEPNSTDFTRVTHWGEYRGYKASNPVVSPDGTRMAYQSARSKDPAGVGYGIFVMDVKEKERK